MYTLSPLLFLIKKLRNKKNYKELQEKNIKILISTRNKTGTKPVAYIIPCNASPCIGNPFKGREVTY